jgi:hypothetical protein
MGIDIYVSYTAPEDRIDDSDDEWEDILDGSTLSVYMGRLNSVIRDLFHSDDKITKEYVIGCIKTLTDELWKINVEGLAKAEGSIKGDEHDISEALCLCSYLVKEDNFPLWLDYSV